MLIRVSETSFTGPVVVRVAADVAFVAWDEATPIAGHPLVTLDGTAVKKPYVAVRLPTSANEIRIILAVRAATVVGSESVVEVKRGGEVVARIDGQSTSDHGAVLVEGLDEAARAQFMKFVLSMSHGGFALGEDPVYAAFCRRLAVVVAPRVTSFATRARLTSLSCLYEGPLPEGMGEVHTVHLLGETRVIETPFKPVAASADGREVLLAVAANVPARGVPALLVSAGAIVSVLLPGSAGAPPILELAERDQLSSAERRYVLRCLGGLALDPEAFGTGRMLQLAAPEPVRELSDPKRALAAGLDLSVRCNEAGLFVRGWIRDPHGLVRDAEIISPFGEARLATVWHSVKRPDLDQRYKRRFGATGFIAFLPGLSEPFAALQHRLRLRTAAGTVDIVPPPRPMNDVEARNAVLGSVRDNDLTAGMLADAIAPAAAALHARVMGARGEAEIVEIGASPVAPAVSIIIPLYRNLSFLRLQIGAFAIDPELRDAEIIYVLDSPEQRDELEHLLRGLHALSGLAFRLVVMPANFGYAAANNAGARASRGRALLLLNSDVIPAAPGWLERLLGALERRQIGVVGPKLLFDDGSLQHAGLMFERDFRGDWYNNHFHKGYPRDWPLANVARSVPAVTGAALLARRDAYERVGGLTEDYIIGDYEDSDFCLKVRDAGWDIRYEPSVELYHFERRSIALHAGYTRTVASAYNRRLHALRWSDAMAELMDVPRRALARRAA
jgi:GT2 family glycosyltransferase